MTDFEIHPKVALPVFAGALVAMVMSFMKSKWQVDFSGQEANLTLVIMALVGYLVPGA